MRVRTGMERRIQTAIADVLLRRWDPIGIRDAPEAADEYDGYIGPIYQLLAAGAADTAIAQRLAEIETGAMGLSKRDWHVLTPVAQELQRVFAQLSSAPRAV